MTLSAIVVITLIAATINGVAVAGALRLMWSETPAPRLVYADHQRALANDGGTLTSIMRAESWVELTTIDTPLVREIRPTRTPVPVLSWGDQQLEAEAEALLNELRKAS